MFKYFDIKTHLVVCWLCRIGFVLYVFDSKNVGDVTCSLKLPVAHLIKPRANTVLPAPKSPSKKIVYPLGDDIHSLSDKASLRNIIDASKAPISSMSSDVETKSFTDSESWFGRWLFNRAVILKNNRCLNGQADCNLETWLEDVNWSKKRLLIVSLCESKFLALLKSVEKLFRYGVTMHLHMQ